MPLHLHPLVLPPNKIKLIREWLGAAGAREFVDYLCAVDAQLTAEAGNALVKSHETEIAVEDARELAAEAATIRLLIDKIAKMREPDFSFEYKEPQKQTATTQPEIK